MRDYTNVDISALTLDDALNDVEWVERQKGKDKAEYFALDMSKLRLCARLNDDQLGRVLRVVCEYASGTKPDYGNEETVVAIVLESIISAHERRVEKVTLNSYKAYVKGKQKGKNKLG